VARPQGHPPELAGEVALLVGHRRAAVDRDGVVAVARLEVLPLPGDEVERLVPARALELSALAAAADERVEQPLGMAHLLVREDALRAERSLVVNVVSRLDADDGAVLHLEVEPALNAAEAAMRRDERLSALRRLVPPRRRRAVLLEVAVEVAVLEEVLVDRPHQTNLFPRSW
jgi:hypothetical protein